VAWSPSSPSGCTEAPTWVEVGCTKGGGVGYMKGGAVAYTCE